MNEEPRLIAEMSLAEKRQKVEELFRDFDRTYLPRDMEEVCQHDFKTCSMLAYKLIAEFYGDPSARIHNPDRIPQILGNGYMLDEPLMGREWLPVRYCGGNMCFGRVFALNICAFSSPDSIVGVGNRTCKFPMREFRILKGLRHVGYLEGWTLFKLDVASTDDMTAMLYLPLEKNFTVEFAHFPHEGGYRLLFHWEDS